MKLFSEDDSDGFEILDEVVERKQPVYIYSYEDLDGNSWWLVSEQEINEDDVDTLFEEKIDAHKRKNSRNYDDE